MKNRNEILYVKPDADNCPADALMMDFRKKINNTTKYSKNIEFSKNSVEFFRTMANIIEESEENIKFYWHEVIEKNLPPLIVKLRKSKERYYLQYLKELGKEEKTTIKGKQRKGKNKNGKLQINKDIEEER